MTEVRAFGVFLVYLSHVIWLYALSERRFSPVRTGLIYGGTGILASVFCILLYVGTGRSDRMIGFLFVLTFLFLLAVYLYLSVGSFIERLFLMISYASLFCILHNSTYLLVSFFVLENHPLYYPLGILFRFLLQAGVLAIYLHLIRPLYRMVRVPNERGWIPLCLAAILIFALFAAWTAVGTNVWQYTPTDMLIFGLISLEAVGIYGVIAYTIWYMNGAWSAALMRRQTEFLQSRVEQYEAAEEASRRFRHDIRHHLLNLASFARDGDCDSLLRYLGEYDEISSIEAPVRYCRQQTVQNILSAYQGKCREFGIRFSVSCDIPEHIPVKDPDLVALLGNMLENGLQGCVDSEEKDPKMEICLRMHGRKILIACGNSCPEGMIVTDGLPVRRGIGVSSMRQVCMRYGGSLYYTREEDICTVSAMLCPVWAETE